MDDEGSRLRLRGGDGPTSFAVVNRRREGGDDGSYCRRIERRKETTGHIYRATIVLGGQRQHRAGSWTVVVVSALKPGAAVTAGGKRRQEGHRMHDGYKAAEDVFGERERERSPRDRIDGRVRRGMAARGRRLHSTGGNCD